MLSGEERTELGRCLRLLERRILTASEIVRRLGAIARPHNLDAVLAELPRELIEPLKAQSRAYRPVHAVGYWRSLGFPPSVPSFRRPSDAEFPDPRRLVAPGLDPADRRSIVHYIRSGHTYSQWRGISYCRFRCGEESMGSRCLTDGAWVWPEGLAHYVEAHSVRLPKEVIERMREFGFQVACDGPMPTDETQGEPDYGFWIAWGRAAESANRPGEDREA